MRIVIKAAWPLALVAALLLSASTAGAARNKLLDGQGNAAVFELFGRSQEELVRGFGPPDRTFVDADYYLFSFFKQGLIAYVHREYDELDRVVLTLFEGGRRFNGAFAGVRLGDHYLSCQARWGMPLQKIEQPDQWYDEYRWKVEGHPVSVQIWNRTADDPNFGYVKELTVKRIEVRRKRDRWE